MPPGKAPYMSLRTRWLPIALSGVFIVCMCAAAGVSGIDETLFPETAAILCGAWMQPRQAWNVDRPRMMALMCSGAVFGLVMNLLVPGPIWVRAVLGFAFCAVAMNLAGADMTPMLSAAILPVLLGTTSWLYPAVVFVLVSLICLGQVALERAGLREPPRFSPLRPSLREAIAAWLRKLVVFALFSAPAYFSGQVFFAVPPLIVTYTELTRPDHSLRLRPLQGWATLALAGATGSVARCAVEYVGLPPALAAALAFAALVLTWDKLRTWLPPAGAVMLLALLVPFKGPWLYPVEVALGAAVWIAAAELLFPGMRPRRGPRPRR